MINGISLDLSYLLKRYQEDIFCQYLGEYPNTSKRYTSLLRSGDTNPGCRFNYHEGVLFFIDNATFNDKLSFTAFDIIKAREGINNIQELIDLVLNTFKPTPVSFTPRVDNEITIFIKTQPFTDHNNILADLHLTPAILNSDPEIHLVKAYWTNTKKDPEIIKNRFHDPNVIPTLAFKFPNGSTKLYFRGQEFKWWSNCTHEIFNSCYLKEFDNSHILVTKSKLDALILYKVFGIQAIGKQQEFGELDLDLSNFKHRFVLYDNDNTGIIQGGKLASSLNAEQLFLPKGNDTADLIKKDFKTLKKFTNDILHKLQR